MDAPSQRSASQFTPYLSANQQDLLVAALNSNSNHPQHTTGPGPVTIKRSASDPDNNQITMDANGNQVFLSPQNGEMDNFDIDYTPELDYLNGDSGFDFENADLGGDMIGALPGRQYSSDDIYANAGDGHEKRKSRDDYDAEEGDAKRQETQEGEKSGAKKPGRKPLTNEPTTVSRRRSTTACPHADYDFRNAKHRTEPHNELSASARSSISKISKPRSRSCPRHRRPTNMRMDC